MKLTRKEMLAGGVAGVLALGLLVAVALGSWQWSVLLVGALVLLVGGVVLIALRRHDDLRTADLQRLEHKIDNLAARVVTEAQATHKELSGLIEELGDRLHRAD